MSLGEAVSGVTASQIMTSRQQRKHFNKSQTLPPSTDQGIFANDALQVIPEKVAFVRVTTNQKADPSKYNTATAPGISEIEAVQMKPLNGS